jgi:hypothetical protein
MKKLKLKFGFFSILAILTVSILVTSCEQDEIKTEITEMGNNEIEIDRADLSQRFGKYEIFEINNNVLWNSVKSQLPGSVNLNLEIATSLNSPLSNLSFNLNRIEVEADEFKMLLIEEGDILTEVNAPETHVLLGQLENGHGKVMVGITKENFRAEVINDEEMYLIEPLSDYVKNASTNQYIKYNTKEIINDEESSCGLTEVNQNEGLIELGNQQTNRSAGNDIVEISALGDYDLYQRNWYSSSNSFSWMYWRMVRGGLRYHYYNNFPVQFRIKAYYLYTFPAVVATDVNNGDGFLSQWLTFLQYNTWFNRGDANILFTGKNTFLNGLDIVGNAYANTICNSIYGWNGPACYVEHQWNSYRADNATAHEVGHIIGHGTWHSVNGFMMQDAAQWTMNPASKTRISNHLAVHSNSICLN